MTTSSLIDRIDALLPQTQCTRCGYDGCQPYARAMAEDDAPINRCPPGGDDGIQALAQLLARDPEPLDPNCGTSPSTLHVAVIDEAHCIGCTLCIQACPVDAIVGANQLMHTVIPDLCTGCELCVAPCPVDCIRMDDTQHVWSQQDRKQARERHQQRAQRLSRLHDESGGPAARTLVNKAPVADLPQDAISKQKLLADVLSKARARRAPAPTPKDAE